ncbi:hypothetical protein [Pseudorhodobacter sp.]|uniref:hypothetical protein n=1 Tax=Pseudorhodobacter sp. TaxID=1934400 RepID=UPI002649C579|nr:hypothetical protein [Pseudorhodobacter sp.]MDN5786637.1 hypothetical protein [Pseudorhodobacter sp.]
MTCRSDIPTSDKPLLIGAALAWFGIFAMITQSPLGQFGAMLGDFWVSLCRTAGQAAFLPLVATWGLMTLAMMLPKLTSTLRCEISHAADVFHGMLAVRHSACRSDGFGTWSGVSCLLLR